MWRLQVLSAIHGAQLGDIIKTTTCPPEMYLTPVKPDVTSDEKKTPVLNPAYDIWIGKNKIVLNFLLSSLSLKRFFQVTTSADTTTNAWAAIEALFVSQSRARVISTRMALATASKGASIISEYFTKMKALVDEMASTRKKLEDDELVSYILTSLDLDNDSVVSAVAAQVEPIFVGELFTQLTSFEQRMELCGGGNNSSTNMATRVAVATTTTLVAMVVSPAVALGVVTRRVDALVVAVVARKGTQ